MNTNERNFYELLGVARNASKEQIRSAYKELSLIFHPDSNFYSEILGSKSAAAKAASNAEGFNRVTEAYKTLSDEAARARYDLTLPPEMPTWEEMPINELGEFRQPASPKKIHGAGKFGAVAPEPEPEPAAISLWDKIKKLLRG